MRKFDRLGAWVIAIGIECSVIVGLVWMLIGLGRRRELPNCDELVGLLFLLGIGMSCSGLIWGLAIKSPRRSKLLMAIVIYLGGGLIVAATILALISRDR